MAIFTKAKRVGKMYVIKVLGNEGEGGGRRSIYMSVSCRSRYNSDSVFKHLSDFLIEYTLMPLTSCTYRTSPVQVCAWELFSKGEKGRWGLPDRGQSLTL